mmetsp:Transcript_15588/g.41297  ORF Transcript_15588/g.41297 Transcript_15588/m.41297 type:complete len:263 (+) Transcript_15588:330-1118(+)
MQRDAIKTSAFVRRPPKVPSVHPAVGPSTTSAPRPSNSDKLKLSAARPMKCLRATATARSSAPFGNTSSGRRGQQRALAQQDPQSRGLLHLLHHFPSTGPNVVHGHDEHASLDGRIGVLVVVLQSKALFLHAVDGECAALDGTSNAQFRDLLCALEDDFQRGQSLHVQEPLHALREPLGDVVRVARRAGTTDDAVAWVDPVLRFCGLVVVFHNPVGQFRDHQSRHGLCHRDAESVAPLGTDDGGLIEQAVLAKIEVAPSAAK